jgi:uncharacterized protein
MLIELSTVASTPQRIDAELRSEELLLDDATIPSGSVRFLGTVGRTERGVVIAGTIEAILAVGCARCLEDVLVSVNQQFEDVFVAPVAESEAEIEVSGNLLDESPVEGDFIDVAEVVREQLILSLPVQAFCNEACKGLCPECGGNRNLIDCSCSQGVFDPRWAALKNLN